MPLLAMTEKEFIDKAKQAEQELFDRDAYPDQFRSKRSELTAIVNNAATYKENLRKGPLDIKHLLMAYEMMFDEQGAEIDKLLNR